MYQWKVASVKGAEQVLLAGGFEKLGEDLVWNLDQTKLQLLLTEVERENNNLIHQIRVHYTLAL